MEMLSDKCFEFSISGLLNTRIMLSMAKANIITVLQILKVNRIVVESGICVRAFNIEKAENKNEIDINKIENQLW